MSEEQSPAPPEASSTPDTIAGQRLVPEREKFESLALLAGNVAHDFNNLLTAILGHAELALMQLPADTGERRQVERIASGARKAADLASELLAFAGRGSVVTGRHDLSLLVDEVTRLVHAASLSDALRLDLARRPLWVEVDGSQLRQAVSHLVTNALQALEQDPGFVRLRTGSRVVDQAYLDSCMVAAGGPGTYAFIEVTDTGRGMEPGHAARAFEPFFSTRPEARGLGLATVLGTLRAHVGAVRLVSAPGRGSTVTLLVPLCEDACGIDSSLESALSGPGHRCLLVVDDEESVREVISEILECAGYQVLLASDGYEALELYAAHTGRIDGVLLDMTMPRMNGVEAQRIFRRDHPGANVVIMSGYSRRDAMRRFESGGVAGFVQKPFAAKTLLETLEDSLK